MRARQKEARTTASTCWSATWARTSRAPARPAPASSSLPKKGKGIVLIIGCGHQKLERALSRTESLFELPIYGVIGGLHFPVTGSRLPFGLQRVIGTGKPPYSRVTKAEVQATIAHLHEKQPKLVGLSAHDSCDWSVGAFRQAFGDRYHDVVVGREIVV